jgi:hypothetical protein
VNRFLTAAALAAAVGLAPAARADGVRVDAARALGKGPDHTVYDNPHLFDALARAWDDQRGKLDKEIEKQLGHLNPKLPRGVNFTQQHSHLAKARITTRVDRGQGLIPSPAMEVVFEAKGNVLTSRFTTPTVFGSYADPEFKVTYDVRAAVHIPVPERTRALAVSAATVEVLNVHITPVNAPAKVVDFAVDVYRVLGGKDYKGMAEKLLSQKLDLKDRVNAQLKPVNKELGKVTNANTKVTVTAKNGFVLRVSNFPAPPSTPPVLH